LIGCTGTLQRKVSKVSNPCKSRSIETLANGAAVPDNIRMLAVTKVDSPDKSIYLEHPAPCNDGQTDSGKTEDSEGFVAKIKTSFAEAKNSFCPTSSEISESYLALVRSQQDFCKNRNVESNDKPKNYHTDRDFFKGMDGVLLKIIPFYFFTH
jgi:hypothetical protein